MALSINIGNGAFLSTLLNKDHGPITQIVLNSRKTIYFAFFLTAIAEILSFAPIIYMMNLFDRVLSSRSTTTLISLTVLLLAAYVFTNAVEWLRRRLLVRFAMRMDWDTSINVFDASFRKFAGRKSINVQQIMGDMVELRSFFQGQAFLCLLQVPFALIFALLAYLFHPWLCYFAFACLTILTVLAYLKQRAATPLMRAANSVSAENDRKVSESLRHSETALALGMMSNIRNRWYESHETDLMVQANATEASGLLGGLAALLTRALPQLSIGLMIFLAIKGEVTGGMAIAGMFLISRTMRPVQGLMNEWHKIVRAKLAMERLEELLAEDIAWQERMPLPEPIGELSVNGLYALTPDRSRTILSGIKFAVEPGQVLAIVGPSAAGKTTLVKHLVGILSPTTGDVRLDGVNVGEWVRSNDCPNIGYVPQETMLLEGTVSENIARMGEVNPDAVVSAAKMAGIHKTILGYPKGYETPVGENGHPVTGGERQRLLIARAYYGDPSLLVMDEPSSSLDAQSEKQLIQTIDLLRDRGKTVILTSHKPTLVSTADLVLVLDGGIQSGFGPANELAQQAKKQARVLRRMKPRAPASDKE